MSRRSPDIEVLAGPSRARPRGAMRNGQAQSRCAVASDLLRQGAMCSATIAFLTSRRS